MNDDIFVPVSKFKEYLEQLVGKVSVRGNRLLYRCPICGDSSNQHKSHGCLVCDENGQGTMTCLKCGTHISFTEYMKKERSDLYERWYLDIFQKEYNVDSIENTVPVFQENIDYSKFIPLKEKRCSAIRNLTLEFVENRKIPHIFARHFYYCEEGKYANRVIIPHFERDYSFRYFEARALFSSDIRYLYPFAVEDDIYNIGFCNFDDDIFVLEGVIDSLFVPNSIACRGASKVKSALSGALKRYKSNIIVFLDGDSTGISQSYRMLKNGYKIFQWDKEMLKYGKDINSLIINGYFKDKCDSNGIIKKEFLMKNVLSPTFDSIALFELNSQLCGNNVLSFNRKKQYEQDPLMELLK